MKNNETLYPLKGVVQHYAWGGYEYIPELIQQKNPDQEPFAELWMGVHDRGPAMLTDGDEEILLKDWLASHPEALGASRPQFGNQLPFLFKVLDVREMLSIQSHPTKEQAVQGFEAENKAGVPLSVPHRNFKDDNHKPEVMVALTDFWLLHGFKPEAEISATLESEPAFAALQPILKDSGIYGLYKTIMEWPQEQVDEVLQPLQSRLSQSHLTDKAHPGFWAKRAFEQYGGEGGNFDRGIFSIYLFNLVHIPPGKGIFQGAGIPHAYLEGVNVELMANSDNVFRGGLTVKHVDVPMLLSHLKFDAITPEVLDGEALDGFEFVYKTPAADFQLNRLHFPEWKRHYKPQLPKTAEIVIVTEGAVVSCNDGQVFQQGEAFFIPAGTSYELDVEEYTTLFKALVPVRS